MCNEAAEFLLISPNARALGEMSIWTDPPPSATFHIGKAGSRNFHGNFRNFIGTFWELSEESDHFPYLATHNAGRSPHMPGTARRQESDHFPYLASLNAERSPTSSIRPPSHAWRARQDGKSGRRGASGTKRPLGRSAAPTESPLHAPRACPTLRDSLSPHTGINGNAWGTAPRPKWRPNV